MFSDPPLGRRVGQVISVILLITWLVEGGYSPECHKDCSWSNWKDEIQSCSQNNTMGRIDNKKSMCPNFFSSSIDREEPAEPIQNVTVSHYFIESYTYPDGRVYDWTFTGLNISFDLDASGFGIYTGAIIEITGVKYQASHFDNLGCFYLSFNGALNSSAVILSNNKKKRFFFDCVRQVAPDSTYQITIKMAPFTSKPAVIRYSIPSCFYYPKDFFCKVPDEELARVWTPETYEVDVSGDRELILDFNLAPFAFDHYKVWLQEIKLEYGKQVNLGKQESCVDIYVQNRSNVTGYSYCSQPHNFTVTWNTTIVKVTFVGVKPATYIVELLPWPLDQNSQQCIKNRQTAQCNVKSSNPYEVKVHEKDDFIEDYEGKFPEYQESKEMQPEIDKINVPGIAIGSLSCVFIAGLVATIIYRSRKNHKHDIYHIDPDLNEDNNSIRIKRIFVVHSFDHPSHKSVVLKLCNFLSNCCKFNVHTPLWGSRNAVKGVNELIARECEEADKIIILCSKGTQLKWRANYRDIPMTTREESYGDIFSIFLRVQRVDYEKNPEKYVVAYMSYSNEEDIPQPLTSLIKYQLMNHMEQMYYHLNDMKKHSAEQDFDIPALQQWATMTDVGVELKKAVDEMKKKIEKDEDWFFSFNEIPDEIAVRIKAKQQRILHPINNDVRICRKPEKSDYISHESNLMQINLSECNIDSDISKISDDEFQLASLASLKQLTGFCEGPTNTDDCSQQRLVDSGIFSLSSNFTANRSGISGNNWPKVDAYANECFA